MKNRAFTAVEMLVVVAILMILIGLLVPALSWARAKARVGIAVARLQGMRTALDSYNLQLGSYPPSTSIDPYSLYECLAGPEGRGVVVDGRFYGPYLPSVEKDEVKTVKVDGVDRFLLLDPWGNPWQYQENASKFKNMRLTKTQYENLIATGVHNPQSYDIFSMGPDGLPGVDTSKGGFIEVETKDEIGDSNSDGVLDIKDNVDNWRD